MKDGQFVVMAAPDVRMADLSVKATILAISIARLLDAIEMFGCSAECEGQWLYSGFQARVRASGAAAVEAYKKLTPGPLPFDLRHSALAHEWRAWRVQEP